MSTRTIARWGTAAIVASLTLGIGGCSAADPALSAKAVGDDHATAEIAPEDLSAAAELSAEVKTEEVPEDVAEELLGYPWDVDEQHPVLNVGIESEVALERYAYTTDKGNQGCPNEFDRPSFTIDAGVKAWFCLMPGGKKDDSANARVDVTYKIAGDPEGRTVWMFAIAPQIGYNRVMCDVKKKDMETRDKTAPYECEVKFGGNRYSFFPGPYIQLKKK